MRIINLASGSKGNSTLVVCGNTKILIDAGLTLKQLGTRLSEVGECLENICGVLVTHEHIDHIRALGDLAKKFDMTFYVEKPLAESDALSGIAFKSGKLVKIGYDKFEVGEVEVLPFSIPHDAVCPVGFVVNAKNSLSKAAFLTDAGHVTDEMKRAVLGAKIIFLESNYDEKMLAQGNYPYRVKVRIASEIGHLSNTQSVELAKFLQKNGTKCFVLSHLSENNNTREIAYLNFAETFEKEGLSLDKDVFVRLSFQNKHGSNFLLNEEYDGKAN